jgi:isoleucyl-tRNA synthetase
MSFPKPPSSPNFFELEEEILQYWIDNNVFEKSIETRSKDNPYRFYDGPPFKNGLPHYGHALQSTIKDIIPRFWTMKGKRVERKRWWDCHGIYIEQKVQAKLGLNSNKDIEKYGVDNFIKACYDFTNEINDERDWFIPHLGRWIDFKNAYQTMDTNYMESVRRVFKSLYDKWLIYKGKRVSMYSTKLNTAISNFEVQADNSYADIADPAITVKFPIIWNYLSDPEREYETTADGFIKVARWVIKNEQWQILLLYIKKTGKRMMPWGKIDKGDNAEQTLQRELHEELWIEIENATFAWNDKLYYKPTQYNFGCYESTFFEVQCNTQNIINKESEKHDIAWIRIEDSENSLGYCIRIENTIIDDADEIITKFMDMNFYYHYTKWNKVISDCPINLLARTTTPRTIPANLGLVIHAEIDYVQIFDNQTQEYFILAEKLLHKYYKNKSDYILIYKCKGKELEWISYNPPFDYYVGQNANDFKVYSADYVSDTDGTGIVHTSPEFGEDDFQTWLRNNLTQTTALDEQGNYTNEIHDMQGMYYRDANELVMEKLKALWKLAKKESITHTVPICPRTQVPLIYKTQDSWFINIQSSKEKLIERCKEINWVPEHMRLGRFLKNIESAPDRCISRTRYWATPMPVWFGYNAEGVVVDTKVIGSIEELTWLTGITITDMHRPWIDEMTRTDNGITYKRTPEVLDNWLDSGSMPYAQDHYPFEHKEHFEAWFPADFIGEWLGQIRAWFYVMHVLGVLLFDTIPYKNVICTWTVLGNDWRKMSKTFGNYPDIKPTIQKYWADALRMFLANSPLLNGGDQPFAEEHLKEVIRKIHLPLRNSFSFFTTYANIDNFVPTKHSIDDFVWYNFQNDLDGWIIWKTAQLILDVNSNMETYNIQKAATPIFEFIEDLTNRYIRRNRRRFWKSENDADKMAGYDVLYVVLIEFCKVLAPFMPFLSEYIFRSLTGKESVHLEYRSE